MNASIPILSAVIGAVVLLFGRKLFWLCVAAIGFAAGVTLASHIVSEPSALLQLTFAILLGFIGAHLITSAISLPPTGEVLLFTALVLLGFLIQAASMRRKGRVPA